MVTYQIICKILSSDEKRIEKVGLVTEGSATNAYQYLKTTEEVNELIQRGNKCFFVNERGDRVEVSKFGTDFIRTNPDNAKHNNLRELSNCKV